MLARMPGGIDGGRVGKGWASIVDVAPTCLSLGNGHARIRSSGMPLGTLVDAPRPGPLFALHDGTLGDRWVPESRRAELERVAVATYSEETKVVVRFAPAERHAYNLLQDPNERTDIWDDQRSDLRGLADQAESVGQALQSLPRQETDSAVQYRLESWGYI